jgi:hypothetical protein
MIVAPISVSCGNPNEWAMFDLQFDPERSLIADDATLRDAIDSNVKMIRRVSANAQPPLLPTRICTRDPIPQIGPTQSATSSPNIARTAS